MLIAGLIALTPLTAAYSETRVRGTVVDVDCGDATNFKLKTKTGELWGTCLEEWCYDVCSSDFAMRKMIGRKISAGVKIVNMEEPESGVLVNEFHDIILEDN